jgi:hypothetical protein
MTPVAIISCAYAACEADALGELVQGGQGGEWFSGPAAASQSTQIKQSKQHIP